MLNAIIFDFDGVILDSEGLHYKVFNQVLEKYKIYIVSIFLIFYNKY